MTWSAAHREAIVAAAEAREELELDSLERIDIFDAIVQDGLKLMFRPLKGVAGFYEPARGAASAGILVNANHPLAMQRYSAAHEYGHHIFGDGRQVDRDGEPHSQSAATPEERRAEAFASWFLMPPEAARNVLRRLGLERPATPGDAYALSLRLGVSYRAICTHLPSLNLASAAVGRGWAELSLKALKQELSATPPPGAWKNDVWALAASDAQAPLAARCGDRLLLDLPSDSLAHIPDGMSALELPPMDLLGTSKLCIDVSVDAAPGPRTLELIYDGRLLEYTVVLLRPMRGRYFSRMAVPR